MKLDKKTKVMLGISILAGIAVEFSVNCGAWESFLVGLFIGASTLFFLMCVFGDF